MLNKKLQEELKKAQRLDNGTVVGELHDLNDTFSEVASATRDGVAELKRIADKEDKEEMQVTLKNVKMIAIKGDTPVKGVDYMTEEDIEEIVTRVMNRLNK